MKTQLYYLSYCPYCMRLKSFLEQHNVEFTLVDVTNEPEEKQLIKDKTGHQTFPQLIINGEFVGDCSSVIENFNEIKEKYEF